MSKDIKSHLFSSAGISMIAFIVVLVVGGVVHAATAWAPGGPPQTAPHEGNVTPPVTAGSMTRDKFCFSTGNGLQISCTRDISLSCPSGQAMTGFANGSAQCSSM